MSRLKTRIAVLVLGLLLGQAAQALDLAAHGASDTRIAIATDAGPAQEHVAAELGRLLEQATGAEFPIERRDHVDSGQPWIQLGVQPAGRGGAPRSPDAYRISLDDKRLQIIGNSPRGLVYGVYRWLETQVGVHWFDAIGGPEVEQRERLRITVEQGWHQPRFAYREVFFRHSDDPAFAAHNRLNGRFGHRLDRPIPAIYGGGVQLRQINIERLVPRAQFAAAHPRFYGGGQLRFANPAMRAVAKRRLREIIAGWEQAPAYILISHADRNTFFNAGADAQLIRRFDAPSAAFVDFVRELAGVVDAVLGQTTILAQAYLWSREPPVGMDLPANMGVMLAGIERDFSQPMDAPGNRDFLADLDGWARLTSHIVVWDYVTNFAGYIQPYPNLHTLAANLRLLAEREAVEGVFAQGAYSTLGAELARLRTWLLARLLWDPGADAGALVAEFVNGYYGPAAPYILAYLDALEAAAKRWPGELAAKTPPDAGYLDTRFLARAEALFTQAAAAAAPEPRYARRVASARIPVDYAILVNRERVAQNIARISHQPSTAQAQCRALSGVHSVAALDGVSAPPARRSVAKAAHATPLNPLATNPGEKCGLAVNEEQRLQRLAANLEAANVTAYREGGGAGIEGLLQALKIDRGDSREPAVCAGLDPGRCQVAGDISLRLAGGGARLVADAAAADGGAALLPGDSRAWGIQLPLADLLPESGRWRIFVIARVEGAQGVCLLQIGVHPGQRQTASCEPGGGYQALAVPGRYSYRDDAYVWVASAHEPAIERILVDRIVAVPAAESR